MTSLRGGQNFSLKPLPTASLYNYPHHGRREGKCIDAPFFAPRDSNPVAGAACGHGIPPDFPDFLRFHLSSGPIRCSSVPVRALEMNSRLGVLPGELIDSVVI